MSILTILVTGAGGFIGSRLCHFLSKEFPKSSIIGIGRRDSSLNLQKTSNYEYIVCELRKGDLDKKLPVKIDALIHLAGDRRTFVNSANYTSQAISNIEMTLNVADYAVHAKANQFIFPSSGYVYSGNSSLPFKEDDVGIPIDNLGASKLAAEALLKARAFSGQFNLLTLRIFTVYGPGSGDDQFIPQTITKLRSTEPIARFGAPDVIRDFIYIDDVLLAMKAGLYFGEKGVPYEVLNVGTGVQTSIREAVLLIADIVGTQKQIEFAPDSRKNDRTDIYHQADITRIYSVLNWKPKIDLRNGLKKTIESFHSGKA